MGAAPPPQILGAAAWCCVWSASSSRFGFDSPVLLTYSADPNVLVFAHPGPFGAAWVVLFRALWERRWQPGSSTGHRHGK